MYFYKKDNNLIILYKDKIYKLENFIFKHGKTFEDIEEMIIKKYKQNEMNKKNINNLRKNDQSFYKKLARQYETCLINNEIIYHKTWNGISIHNENKQWESNFNLDVFFDNVSIDKVVLTSPTIKKKDGTFYVKVKTKGNKIIAVKNRDILECFFYICKEILSQFYGYNYIGIGRSVEESKVDYLLKNKKKAQILYQDQLSKELGLILAR